MRHWVKQLSLITVASAFGSATVTVITKVFMAQSTAPKSDQQRARDDDEEGDESKKPLDKQGLKEKLTGFVNDLRNQLPDFSLPKPSPVLDGFTMGGVVRYIQEGKAKNIIVMTGAGISTSAGIPDFRSPGTGLYDNLAEYNLPHPQAIFEIGYFRENPEPFFKLAKELFPGKLKPTPCHYFIRLLHEKGMLLRTYTQNIDALEHLAGVPQDKIIEAHGTFRLSHCTMCNEEYDLNWIREKITATVVPRCEKCESVVKPDIVFFGEALPTRFFTMVPQDFGVACDLLIIMGTSLVVQPFASLIDRVPARVPRMLINKDKAGQADSLMRMMGFGSGLEYDDERNYRDVYWSGTCDDGCQQLAEMLGWGDELKAMIAREWLKLDEQENRKGLKKDIEKPGKSTSASSNDNGSKI